MKKSRFLSLVLTLSVLAALFLPVSASALEEPALNCTHAVLLDANYNEVLYEKGAYEKAYPASITKVMTALLVLEAIDSGKLSRQLGWRSQIPFEMGMEKTINWYLDHRPWWEPLAGEV